MEPFEPFLNDIPATLGHFPELSTSVRNGTPILSGGLNLTAQDGEHIDRYEIEIHPSVNYPDSYPLVYETGGRIPRNIDWHVYADGHFCIAVPVQERLDCLNGINLRSFIEKQVIGFLFNQTFRRNNGYFHRERAHGLFGRLQFYNEHLGLHDLKATMTALQIIATDFEIGSHSKCFCGTAKKYKKCHRRLLRDLKRKAGSLVKNDYNEIKTIVASIKGVT